MSFAPHLACIAMPFIRPMALFTLLSLALGSIPLQVPGEKPSNDDRLAYMMD